MKFLGIEISEAKALDGNQIILDGGKEKLTLTVDPAGKDPAYYILAKTDSRGGMQIIEHGELNGRAKRVGGKKRW